MHCNYKMVDFCSKTVKHQLHVMHRGRKVTQVADRGPTGVQWLWPTPTIIRAWFRCRILPECVFLACDWESVTLK